MDSSTRLCLFLNANLVPKVRKELRKVVRNSFGACWALRVAMPHLLLSDSAVLPIALDSRLLPVSMGGGSRVEAVSQRVPEVLSQLRNGVTDACVRVPGRATIRRLL